MNGKNAGILLLMVASFVLVYVSDVFALQIIYPEDNTYVTKSNYLIIKGGVDPFLDGMSVDINGLESEVLDLTSEKYRALFADMLLLEPSFDPGENRIIVKGYINDEVFAEVEANIYYLEDKTAAAPRSYKKEQFHFPEREAPCVKCHIMKPTEIQLADPRIATNPCASCHKRMLNQNHVHGPAGVFDCVYCHDASSRPAKYLPREGDALVCRECHADKMQGFEDKKFTHGPIEGGLCLVCHDPHASPHVAQLQEEANRLCLGCHSKVDTSSHVTTVGFGQTTKGHPVAGSVNPSAPNKVFNCASCHDPHGGASKYLFVGNISSRMSLCQVCHQK